MKYYGFMVSELSGSIEDLEGTFDYKPSHESCGFAFAKWFENERDKDISKLYIINEIKNKQLKRD